MSRSEFGASKWDWLADPADALRLFTEERKAFYDWQEAAREWSEATGRLVANEKEKETDEQQVSLAELRKRLDAAAEAYEAARKRLHEAWSS